MEDNSLDNLEFFQDDVVAMCLICGTFVKQSYSPACEHYFFICDECKKAVMWAKTRMDGDVLTS